MNQELKTKIYDLLLEVKREGVEGIYEWYVDELRIFLPKSN